MPRFQLVSDLHLEFYQDGGRSLLESRIRWDDRADAIILAGDVGAAGRNRGTLEYAFRFFSERFPHVLYVPGNHEFYGCVVPKTLDQIRKLVAQYPKVTLLEPGVISKLGDRRVLGSTLWFPFAPNTWELAQEMSDFTAIKGFRPWVYEQNKAHATWLTEAMLEGDIVVTHHLPSARSVAARFADDPLNIFFLCDMEKLIEERRPAFWAHGHTHDSCRYTIGPTVVACNPLGYPGEENPQFLDGAWPL